MKELILITLISFLVGGIIGCIDGNFNKTTTTTTITSDGEQGLLSALVTDTDGVPIEMASVYVVDSVSGVTGQGVTDENGLCQLNVPGDSYTATISASGYVTKTVTGTGKMITVTLEAV